MKVSLDACMFDWLLDSPRAGQFLASMRLGAFSVRLSGDVVAEVYRTPDPERRYRLMATLFTNFNDFLPIQASMIQRHSKKRRRVIGILGTPPAMALRQALAAIGVRKLEAVHLIDAHFAGCSAFLTLDEKDLLRRRDAIRRVVAVDVLRPEELLESLSDGE